MQCLYQPLCVSYNLKQIYEYLTQSSGDFLLT